MEDCDLFIGELFKYFEVNYLGKNRRVYVSVDGGIGLLYKSEGKFKFIF